MANTLLNTRIKVSDLELLEFISKEFPDDIVLDKSEWIESSFGDMLTCYVQFESSPNTAFFVSFKNRRSIEITEISMDEIEE